MMSPAPAASRSVAARARPFAPSRSSTTLGSFGSRTPKTTSCSAAVQPRPRAPPTLPAPMMAIFIGCPSSGERGAGSPRRPSLRVYRFLYVTVLPTETPTPAHASPNTATPIQHVIIIVGENRSFDHLYATYTPKAKGDTVMNLLSQGIVRLTAPPGRISPGDSNTRSCRLPTSENSSSAPTWLRSGSTQRCPRPMSVASARSRSTPAFSPLPLAFRAFRRRTSSCSPPGGRAWLSRSASTRASRT